jgi:hypothetical protein
MKHTSWLSGFARFEAERRGAITDLGLGEMADGEQCPSQFALRQHVHDVALILRRVRAAVHEEPVADGLGAGMVTGGNRIEAEDVGALAESVELQVTVALDARVRRETSAVRSHIGIDDVGVEVVGEVEHEMVDVQLLGNATGVVDIGDRAAPVSLSPPHRRIVMPTTW